MHFAIRGISRECGLDIFNSGHICQTVFSMVENKCIDTVIPRIPRQGSQKNYKASEE